MKPRTLSLTIILTAAALAVACGDEKRRVSPTGPTESGGIVVERTTLRSKSDCEGFLCTDSCELEGTVRNDTTTARKVTVRFTAFDGAGRAICQFGLCTDTVELVVPPGGRSNYSVTLLVFEDCDRVARVEITELKSEPA